MKKIIGVFSAAMLSLMLVSGCQRLEGEAVTDTAETVPTAPDESIVTSINETEITDNTSSDGTEPDSTDGADTEAVPTTAPESDISDTANQIIQTAESLLGIPFVMNGASPDTGFDNPGFIYYVLRENGFINCPRLIGEQSEMGTHTDYGSLKKGDLVYFSTDDSGQADFGGIYIGDGQMIYCPYPEQTVQIVSISSDYWVNAFYIGVRLS